MSNIIIDLDKMDPTEFLGVHNAKLDLLKKAYPKLKIVSRGNKIKISGNPNDIQKLKSKTDLMMDYIGKFGILSDSVMRGLLADPTDIVELMKSDPDEMIVTGTNGMAIKPRTPNQFKLVELSNNNDILFAVGPAGTGKTYVAVALAVRALKSKRVKRIILTRPAVEAGENLGFLPGDLKEKVDPYLRPLYDALDDMLHFEKIKYYIDNRIIEIAPLAFMRGRTLDKSFIILDEGQNATATQLKMFLTRLGPSAKCIITGDLTQIDLGKHQESGLANAIDMLKSIDGIGVINLTSKDVIRHPLVGKIIDAYDARDKMRKVTKS